MRLSLNRKWKSWLTRSIIVAVAGVGFLSSCVMDTEASAPHDGKTPLDCLRCHTRALKEHDKLGSGSEACWTCHDSIVIGKLTLLDGTKISIKDSNRLCGECHSKYYDDWKKDKHGILPWYNGKREAPDFKKPKCVGCHNAHHPKIKLLKGTIPSPLPDVGLEGPLDCVSCHSKVLEGHDKLGTGSKACWACHYDMEMGVFHSAGREKPLRKADFPLLCSQCHWVRYQEWIAGTHGIPAWEMGSVNIHGVQRVGCNGCHDPHQPQVAYSDITIAHPSPQPSPASPSPFLFILLGAVVLLVAAVVISVVRKEEWP